MEVSSETPGNFQLWSSTAAVINVIYSDISSRIVNDGFATKQYNLGRGVRQGCPLSTLSCILFTIGIEILANAIRSTNDLKGIEIDDANTTKTYAERSDKSSVTKIVTNKGKSIKIRVVLAGIVTITKRDTLNLKLSKEPISALYSIYAPRGLSL